MAAFSSPVPSRFIRSGIFGTAMVWISSLGKAFGLQQAVGQVFDHRAFRDADLHAFSSSSVSISLLPEARMLNSAICAVAARA